MALTESDIVIVAGAVMGVLRSFERFDPVARDAQGYGWTRILLLAWVAGVAAVQADSVRGFLYLTLMPIGAYQVARVIAAPIAARRGVVPAPR